MNDTVELIDRNKKNIILENGGKYSYQKLVLATGSELNILDITCDKKNIYYLRTIDDSIKIRSLFVSMETTLKKLCDIDSFCAVGLEKQILYTLYRMDKNFLNYRKLMYYIINMKTQLLTLL